MCVCMCVCGWVGACVSSVSGCGAALLPLCLSGRVWNSYICSLSTQLLDILDAVGGARYSVYDIESAVTYFDSSPAEIGRGPANVSVLVDLETELR